MTKKDLVNVVSDQMGATKKLTGEFIDAIFDAITNTMVSGDEMKIAGFGIFTSTERGERTYRNPSTGGQVVAPATKVPKFKAAKALKEAVAA